VPLAGNTTLATRTLSPSAAVLSVELTIFLPMYVCVPKPRAGWGYSWVSLRLTPSPMTTPLLLRVAH
jgi:hypothetical protein